ncbi:protein kinase [Sorangium sp. So ce834]|uniref:serine/threonine-protein kinase n=1 Tax=Sorangium sp. So ce834 TaxID=3133321 RepID=UPI003F60E2EB
MSERPPETTLTPEEAAKQRAVSYLGRVISKRYRIDEVIAMGGMGAVYRGEHVHMHKRVAIKILHPDTERLPELVQRFEREAIAGAHIQHRNVATATDFGEAEDGSFFLVLEYVRGTTLHEIIRRGPMPAARAAVIARQLAAALGATHAMSIVHRDVKPRNVMVVEPQGDLVKLIDFGLAKVSVDQLRRSVASPESTRMEGEPLPVRLTTAGVIFGTIAYLAPESALGMDFVDERADLYALGLIFYEMLAGKHPFLAKDPVELFNQQRSAPVPAIAEHAPGVAVPPAIEAVVRRLLEKQPRARFESAAELIAALDAACAASGIAMDEPRAEMGSRAEMTSVPAIGEAARVPSNRPPSAAIGEAARVPSNRPPPLPSAAPPREPSNRPPPLPSAGPPREPETDSGGSSAIVLGDSCLVSLTDVVDELEPAAQRAAGEPAAGGASAPEPACGSDGAPAEGTAQVEPAEDADEEDAASYSRPTPVRNTPTLVAELTRDSRPTAVGGAAFMAQVAFSRQESAGDAAAEVEAAPLSSDSRPTAVGGAAFMAQVAFSREEAARDAASGAGAPSPRSGEQTASQEPAPLVSTPPPEEAPSLAAAEPVRPLEEPVPEEREGSASTRPPMGATSPEPSERGRSAPSPEKPSQPGTAELTAPAGERTSSKPPSSPAAGPASSKPPPASAGERASSKPPSASAGERASSKPPSSPAAEPASSKPPSSPAAEGAPSKPPSSPAAEAAPSKPPSSPAAEVAPSKPPSSPAAEAAPSKPPSSPTAEAAPSKPPSSPAAEAAPSKPPSSPAAEAAPPPPPAPSVEDPASPATSQPPEKAPPPAATSASPSPDEPPAKEEDAPASEPTSERMSGSRPAFTPTLLRELEAAEAERIAREREEEAKRKLAEEAERAAKEREEKARRKRAAREARASRRRDEGAGGRLGRLAPYLGGALIAVGAIAALASSGRAPPEPEPQLGRAAPAASALATSEPDAAAAPEVSGPTAAAPEDAAPATPAAPEAPVEPPPDEATRKALTDAARARRWVKAAEALNLLAERDPTALRERPIAIAARNLAIAISKTGEALADQVFDALARRFGTAGLDVLYEIVETRGRSTPATRAAKLLRDPEVAARGTPAVRISFELRDATCGEKMPFLDRAVSEGDQRTLVVLETAVRPCYTKNRTIDEAIKKLRARLEGG